MSGAGFLWGTQSPASRTSKRAARSGPAAWSRIARTDGSAEVEATASFQPASCASAMIRRIPGRGGSFPAATISV